MGSVSKATNIFFFDYKLVAPRWSADFRFLFYCRSHDLNINSKCIVLYKIPCFSCIVCILLVWLYNSCAKYYVNIFVGVEQASQRSRYTKKVFFSNTHAHLSHYKMVYLFIYNFFFEKFVVFIFILFFTQSEYILHFIQFGLMNFCQTKKMKIKKILCFKHGFFSFCPKKN